MTNTELRRPGLPHPHSEQAHNVQAPPIRKANLSGQNGTQVSACSKNDPGDSNVVAEKENHLPTQHRALKCILFYIIMFFFCLDKQKKKKLCPFLKLSAILV